MWVRILPKSLMQIYSYDNEGVWIKIPYTEIMDKGYETAFEELVQLTSGMSLVTREDDDDEMAVFALFQ